MTGELIGVIIVLLIIIAATALTFMFVWVINVIWRLTLKHEFKPSTTQIIVMSSLSTMTVLLMYSSFR